MGGIERDIRQRVQRILRRKLDRGAVPYEGTGTEIERTGSRVLVFEGKGPLECGVFRVTITDGSDVRTFKVHRSEEAPDNRGHLYRLKELEDEEAMNGENQ